MAIEMKVSIKVKTCEICGTQFKTRYKNARFCNDCREVHHNQVNRERRERQKREYAAAVAELAALKAAATEAQTE